MRWEDVSDEQLIEEVRNRGYTIQNGEIVMSKQPEALRLIDWFDEEDGFQHGTKAPHKWVLQTAAELRRLHEENERLREAVAAEREACAKVCDEKYEAVPESDPYAEADGDYSDLIYAEAAQDCAAAIRARGEREEQR